MRRRFFHQVQGHALHAPATPSTDAGDGSVITGTPPTVTRRIPASLVAKLTAAADSFASTFDDVRMDDIAKASGIPRATLYYHFSSKNEVLAFLLQGVLADLRVSVAKAARSGDTTSARLAAVIRAQLDHLASNPGVAQLLLANLGKGGRLPAIAAGIDKGFHAPVRQILSDGMDDGTLVAADIEVLTTALFGAVTAVGFQRLLADPRVEVDQVYNALFSVFWSGIALDGIPYTSQRTR